MSVLNEKMCKTDNNKVINAKCIRWIRKMDECLEVCVKSTGCRKESGGTHRVCKLYNLDSYNKLNKYFE